MTHIGQKFTLRAIGGVRHHARGDQLLFGLFSIGNISHCTQHAQRTTVLIALHQSSACLDPSPLAILLSDAELSCVDRRQPVQMLLCARSDGCQIVGMNACCELVETLIQVFQPLTEQVGKSCVPDLFSRLDIPVPCTNFTASEGHVKAFTFKTQALFCPAGIGHIGRHTHESRDLSVFIARCRYDKVHRKLRSVFPDVSPV